MDLFEQTNDSAQTERSPLAVRMRPVTIEDIVGQDHILGPGKLLRRAIESDRLGSIILYGPPGCGKTSIAEVIARITRRSFERASGAVSNVSDLRAIIDRAARRLQMSGEDGSSGTILFMDEIHRFNKSQQDVLLPHVENGTVTLIGATTHNPLFFINAPLNSRSLIFELNPLSEADIKELLKKALRDERGLAESPAEVEADAFDHLANVSEGDARRALNALEIAVMSTPTSKDGKVRVTRAVIEDSVQKRAVVYDHDEDGHYDTISAFIKSVRGSDPDAAVYWLAKMLSAGEDPRFIARRLVILASEDIGNADPRGLYVATSAMQASEFVGMPEARIILSQATTYLASAPKSNAAYVAVNEAMADVEKGRTLAVPEHLKNIKIPTHGSKKAGESAYKYPHDFEGHFTPQEYALDCPNYYRPSAEGYEEVIGKRLERWRAARDSSSEGKKS